MILKVADWIIRIAIAVVLVQTLWFKFRAAPESVVIFTALHVEPWGRIFAGVVELGASLLVLFPRTALYGALVACGTMARAMFAHIFVIGIAVGHDGGFLFALAVAVALGSLFCIYMRRAEIGQVMQRMRSLWQQ
jgi:uncharacterized membrane protein YphA (DoxX/SURF4 family)